MSFDLLRWFAEVGKPGWIWYARYLSANDTQATGAHQAGFYIPKVVFGTLFPTAATSAKLNPSHTFPAVVAAEGSTRIVRAIWYNNRIVQGKTRDECRITRWGGSPLMDPEATGSLSIFAFRMGQSGDAEECRIWLCRDPIQEEIALDWLGFVEPGAGLLVSPSGEQVLDVVLAETDGPCVLRPDELPVEWREAFPDPATIAAMAVANLKSARKKAPDDRLILRRECEYQLFRSVEEVHVLPKARAGFESVDQFLAYANSVTNRRKSRSGRSLEYQVRIILEEQSVQFSHGAVSENNKRPDFLFPAGDRYADISFPESKLRMLAVKTTCKDRWRQVIDEADRIPVKHLLTLQRGVSISQYKQMNASGIKLVVPGRFHDSFPEEIRGGLLTLSRFIEEVSAQV